MTPLRVKTFGKSEFYIYEAKKCSPHSGKACVWKQKVAKMRFFEFSLQYTGLPIIRKVFFPLKMLNSDFPHIFTLGGGSFQAKKIFENFFTWVAPSYCVVAQKIS